MKTLSADKWSQYWQKGTITTFHKKFENNYDGSIKKHWDDEFSRLSTDAQVIDLATGNGALLGLLNQYASSEQYRIAATGVDFADLHAEFFEDFSALELTLKQRTAIEQTDLPDNHYDLAISQYGFEYADCIAAVDELSRICKPQCRISFIMHNQESQIVREGFQSLEQIELVNKNLGLPELIKNMVEAIDKYQRQKNEKSKRRADKYRDKLNNAIMKLREAASQYDDPSYLQFFHDNALAVFNPAMSGNMSVKEKLQVLRNVDKETRSLIGRMEDLTSVAMSDEKNTLLINQLKNHKFSHINVEQLQYNGFHIGQLLTAERN
ncbi:class I SAM-dependent methyltransferase [Marinicella sp. W31]|uniref:class I SAM-dependent methyltransferase n=1 Tax=Marinicella sp. W31 TaxID=3023713 RepID=UPI0037572636